MNLFFSWFMQWPFCARFHIKRKKVIENVHYFFRSFYCLFFNLWALSFTKLAAGQEMRKLLDIKLLFFVYHSNLTTYSDNIDRVDRYGKKCHFNALKLKICPFSEKMIPWKWSTISCVQIIVVCPLSVINFYWIALKWWDTISWLYIHSHSHSHTIDPHVFFPSVFINNKFKASFFKVFLLFHGTPTSLFSFSVGSPASSKFFLISAILRIEIIQILCIYLFIRHFRPIKDHLTIFSGLFYD